MCHQFSLVTQSGLLICNPMDCSMPGFPVHHQLPEVAQTRVHRVSDTSQPSHPLSSPSPPALNLSQHRGLFQWVSSSHFSFSISLSKDYSGLTSFRIDWFDLLAVQGTLKSLLQTTVQGINSLVLSFLYSPTLTSICDYCKNHSRSSCTIYSLINTRIWVYERFTLRFLADKV